MTEWHFDRHADGWSWRCTTQHGEIASIRCFTDIRGAIADAALHGYVSGASRIGSMGPVRTPATPRRRRRLTGAERPIESRLVIRRNIQFRWIWELRSRDGHLLNRSDFDFPRREDCEADAKAHGQTVGQRDA